MKITQFNRQNLRDLSNDLESAIKVVAEKYGIQIRRGRCSFLAAQASMKLELAILNESGQSEAERETFSLYCERYGLKQEHFKATFRYRQSSYTVEGINHKAKGYPIKVVRDDGAAFRMPSEVVVAALSAAPVK